MLIVDHYHYLPGACTLCRSSNLPAVDTGVDLDWQNSPYDDNPSANRRLYICADCCINLADMVKESRAIQLRPAQHYEILEALNQEVSQKNAVLHHRVNELEAAIATINSVSKTQLVVDEKPAINVTEFKVTPPPKGAK